MFLPVPKTFVAETNTFFKHVYLVGPCRTYHPRFIHSFSFYICTYVILNTAFLSLECLLLLFIYFSCALQISRLQQRLLFEVTPAERHSQSLLGNCQIFRIPQEEYSVSAASRETANGRKLRSSPKSSPTQRTEMHKKAGRGVKADLTGKLDNRSQINCGQVQILYDIQARQLKDQSRDNTWPGTALSEMIRKPNIFKYQYSAVPCQHSAKRLENEISSST